MKAKGKIVWHSGIRIRLTGKSEMMYGALFHEGKVMEGHKKGEQAWVSDRQYPQNSTVA